MSLPSEPPDPLAAAYAAMRRGAFETARLELEHAVGSGEASAEVHFQLGALWCLAGDPERARASFARAVACDPLHAGARAQLDAIERGYRFTVDWFTPRLPACTELLRPLGGRRHLQVVEIGAWEGRATIWLLDHVATHPTSRIAAIDAWAPAPELVERFGSEVADGAEARFDANIARTGRAARVRKLKRESAQVLRVLPLESVDLVYVDGGSLPAEVLTDAVLAWDVLRPGGYLFFAAYDRTLADMPDLDTRVGIDAFLDAFAHRLELVHAGGQVLVRRRA